MRLIDADALKPKIDKFIGYLDEDMIYRIKVVIDNASTVIPEDFMNPYEEDYERARKDFESQKTGHWIFAGFCVSTTQYKCSRCKLNRLEKTDFCPNCGAKMIRTRGRGIRNESK